MRPSGLLPIAVLFLVAACSEPGSSGENAAADVPLGSGFDFYVLALSWSPGYCEAEGLQADRFQCRPGSDFGFVVHGLWPQFERGWPEFCDTDEPDFVPDDQVRTVADIMPSAGLVGHQWRRHGTCTGLDQVDYLAVTRAAFDRISLPPDFVDRGSPERFAPDAVERAFLTSNAGLSADAIAVTCHDRFLRDVRICLSRDLEAFVPCPEVDERACPLPTVVIPPKS